MTTSDLLAVVAIVLSVVAIVVTVLLYRFQTGQGERIGLTVFSALRTMQRVLPAPPNDDQDDDAYVDYSYWAQIEPPEGFIKRMKTATLKLTVMDAVFSGAWQCIVVTPSGRVFRSPFSTRGVISLVFPMDFEGADTKTPGIYRVSWMESEQWSISGKTEDDSTTWRERPSAYFPDITNSSWLR